uniref:Putative secreted protein n=1 Tax=Anopheles darlingi TaxID=43151 RepID=A0A2M4DLD1_ANODA
MAPRLLLLRIIRLAAVTTSCAVNRFIVIPHDRHIASRLYRRLGREGFHGARLLISVRGPHDRIVRCVVLGQPQQQLDLVSAEHWIVAKIYSPGH